MTHGRSFFHSEYLPLPAPPRLSSAAAHGLLPSAASTTSLTGRPDPRGVGVKLPPRRHNTPFPTTLRCSRGEPGSFSAEGRGGSLLPVGGFRPGATRLMAFGMRGREGKTAPAARGRGVLPQPGLEPAAQGRGGAGQRRGPRRGRPRRAAGRGRRPPPAGEILQEQPGDTET